MEKSLSLDLPQISRLFKQNLVLPLHQYNPHPFPTPTSISDKTAVKSDDLSPKSFLFFAVKTTFRRTFLSSELQCLPWGDPRKSLRKDKDPITGNSFSRNKVYWTWLLWFLFIMKVLRVLRQLRLHDQSIKLQHSSSPGNKLPFSKYYLIGYSKENSATKSSSWLSFARRSQYLLRVQLLCTNLLFVDII